MESSSQTSVEPGYPVRFSVEYPDRELNRGTTAFRLIVAIPILILAASIGSLAGASSARPASTARTARTACRWDIGCPRIREPSPFGFFDRARAYD